MPSPLPFIKDLFAEWKRDDVLGKSAQISFFAVFSLPALILIVLSVASMILGTTEVEAEAFGRIQQYIGTDAASLIQRSYEHLHTQQIDNWIGWLSVLFLTFSAINVIYQLRKNLNTVLELSKSSRPNYLRRLIGYVLSLLVLILTSFLLISSIVIASIAAYVGARFSSIFSIPVDAIAMANHLVTFIFLTLLLFLLYLFLPYKRYPVLPTFVASAATSLFSLVGTGLFSLYISSVPIGVAYGAAASVLVLLLWLFYSINVFLFGGEIIDVWSKNSEL